MGFSALSEVLVGADLRGALFEAQTLSYRLLILKCYRNRMLPIGNDPTILDIHNPYYNTLRSNFDAWDSAAVEEQMSDDGVLTQAVRSTILIRGKKRTKRAKKQSSRVLREAKKMWKLRYYGENKDILDAIYLIHKAFRESFLNIRLTLRTELYECIPEFLTIKLNNQIYLVRSLYLLDEGENRYRLRRDIVSSSNNLRDLQLEIVPYIFEKIYMK